MFVLQFHESSFFFKLSLCVLDPSFEHHVDIFWNTIDSTGQNPPRFFLHLCLPFLPSLNSLNVTSVFASVCSLHLHYSWPPLLNLILSEFLQSPGDPFLVRELLRKAVRAELSCSIAGLFFETSFEGSAGHQDLIASPSPAGWQGRDTATCQLLHFLESHVMILVFYFLLWQWLHD